MTALVESVPLDRFSVAERVELLERVWDSLIESEGAVPPRPEWHAREVTMRIADADANPDDFITLEDLSEELLGDSP